ncbi:hypothetical protein BSZ35_18385 [Salinibacter sp. 10B]|uniref:hypothetical protein n=1 Tax=Salinibacter sp. 10B TaxID=1923971 RepID=UPI000CF4E9E4|nr:hypothetical protein [Salinibacter sp. 10B]PQJ26897.1 hypothetical protein BSZ35_18385 [Salinibacter sp. 10B]
MPDLKEPDLEDKIEELREETGLSTEELLTRLKEEREALVRDRYGEAPTGEEGSTGNASQKSASQNRSGAGNE